MLFVPVLAPGTLAKFGDVGSVGSVGDVGSVGSVCSVCSVGKKILETK